MNRYRLYDRLMTFGFYLAVLGQIQTIGAWAGLIPEDLGIWNWPLGLVTVIGIFLLPFLVVARFMRDEFAEMLWHKAAASTMLALVLLPIPIMIIVFANAEHEAALTITNAVAEAAKEPVNRVGVARMVGIGESVLYFWVIIPEVFLIAYQWHRWRA